MSLSGAAHAKIVTPDARSKQMDSEKITREVSERGRIAVVVIQMNMKNE